MTTGASHSITQTQNQGSKQTENEEQTIGSMASNTSHVISETHIQDSHQAEDGEKTIHPMATSTLVTMRYELSR